MRKFVLFVILLLAISALAQDAKKPETPKPDVSFNAVEEKELNELLGRLKTLAPQIQEAEKQLRESPLYLKLESLTNQRQSATNKIEAVIARACGEGGIKPSECDVTADGKGLKRKPPAAPTPQVFSKP